jgi:hypothetical protein
MEHVHSTINNTYIHTHTQTNSKPNCLNSLFPQNGYNVRIKDVHILNAPPFTDVLISLLKQVLNSKLAERVSDFNRFHFLLVLNFAISISIRSFHWQCNIFFFGPKLTKSTDTYFFIGDSIVLGC